MTERDLAVARLNRFIEASERLGAFVRGRRMTEQRRDPPSTGGWHGRDRTGTWRRWICRLVGHDLQTQPSHILCWRCEKLAHNFHYMVPFHVPRPSDEWCLREGYTINGQFPDEAVKG